MSARTRVSVAAALVALALLVILGAVLISTYIEQERQRDLLQWESRLGLVADARVDAVQRLLAAERRGLEELAANVSLRFYLWQARATGAGPTQAAPGAQGSLGYLRNLLLASAERLGYESAVGVRVPASVGQARSAGLVLFDAAGEPVVATPGLLDVAGTFGDLARSALAAEKPMPAVLMRDSQDDPVLVTALPVGAVPGTRDVGPGAALGVLVGIRSAESELYPLLTRGPAFAEENESLLLERRDGVIALLSPTRDGSPGLRRTLPAERGDLAEVAAFATPGGFVALDNYRGRWILQVSRPIRGQGWLLVQQVDAGEALSLADDRRRFLLTALSLLLFSIAAVAVAAWRHGSSVRARHQAGELADKAARLQRQTDLLHTITDNVDVLTLLVSRDQRLLFVNQAAAALTGSSIQDMLGGTLGTVLPAGLVGDLQAGIDEARSAGAPIHRLLRSGEAERATSYHVSFIPVERIGHETGPVLLVLSDVSAIEQLHQRNTGLLRRLVLTLVGAVDRHDPFAADHARRMMAVVDAVARELGFGDQERSTLDLAASLANIGKIMIPADLLVRRDPLSAADQELLRRHVDYGLELLRGLQFDGPVLDIIAQKQERLDGGGYPRGLSGDRITRAGQVLAVANAFVALISARSYRPGLSIADALAELRRVAGTGFDLIVVDALSRVAARHPEWAQWVADPRASGG